MASFELGSELLNYIITSGLQSGERLPAINELASDKYLGISTSKVREQLEVARALGLVEVRSKTGTRLKDFDFAPAVRLSLFYALARDLEMFEMFGSLRQHLEMAFWHEACALITETEIESMRECIEAAQTKLNSHPIRIPMQEHRNFHLAIFHRLENPFVTGLLEAYWDAYDAISVTHYAEYAYLQRVWDYHARIFDAIVRRDFETGRQLFIEHTKLLRYQLHPEDMNVDDLTQGGPYLE